MTVAAKASKVLTVVLARGIRFPGQVPKLKAIPVLTPYLEWQYISETARRYGCQ